MSKKLECRVDKWIETRIWNGKINDEIIPTSIILNQVNSIFKLKMTQRKKIGILNMKKKIRKVRFRVNKRFNRRQKLYSKLSKRFFVPEKMVMRWIEGGLINASNPFEVERISLILKERDFYRDFESEITDKDIPISLSDKLWDISKEN